MKGWIGLALCCWMTGARAQTRNDTTCYVRFGDRLAVSLYQSQRSMTYLMSSRDPLQATAAHGMNYTAQANTVSGFELDYDKLSLALNFKSTSGDVKTFGFTNYHDFHVAIGGNVWILEAGYRRYKGFYDTNTSAYDTSWKQGMPLFQNTGLTSEAELGRFTYFLRHKKFSYKAAYTCSYRQLRSNWSPILEGYMFHENLFSDSFFVPSPMRANFGSMNDLLGLDTYGISAGAGVSATLVIFHRVFVNITLAECVESQWREYHQDGSETRMLQYFSIRNDERASLGYNGNRFFFFLSARNDIGFENGNSLSVQHTFNNVDANLGYRFRIPDKGLILKLKNNKYYKML